MTAHWISYDETNRRITLKAALIGFHRMKVRHTGVNIAKTILHILDRADVTLKVWFPRDISSPAVRMLNHALDRVHHT